MTLGSNRKKEVLETVVNLRVTDIRDGADRVGRRHLGSVSPDIRPLWTTRTGVQPEHQPSPTNHRPDATSHPDPSKHPGSGQSNSASSDAAAIQVLADLTRATFPVRTPRFVADSIPHVGLEELRPFDQVLAEPNSALTVKDIEFTLQQTTDFTSNYLRLDAEANIWFRESLVSIDSNAVAIVQEYLPAGRYLSDASEEFARFPPEAAKADATVLKSALDHLGPTFSGAVCHIAANIAGHTRGQLIGLKASEPVLVLTQTAEIDGTPAYLAKCIVSTQVGSLSIIQSNG